MTADEDRFPKKGGQSPPQKNFLGFHLHVTLSQGRNRRGTTLLGDACVLSHSILFCQRSKWFTMDLSPQSLLGLLRSPGGEGKLSDEDDP